MYSPLHQSIKIPAPSIPMQPFIPVGHNLEMFDYLETTGTAVELFRFTPSQMVGREYALIAPGQTVMQ